MPGGVPDLTPRQDLNWSPKVNEIERRGGLPKYVESVASALIDRGIPRSRAIAIAVVWTRKVCATGHAPNLRGNPRVSPAVRAAACAAAADFKARLTGPRK